MTDFEHVSAALGEDNLEVDLLGEVGAAGNYNLQEEEEAGYHKHHFQNHHQMEGGLTEVGGETVRVEAVQRKVEDQTEGVAGILVAEVAWAEVEDVKEVAVGSNLQTHLSCLLLPIQPVLQQQVEHHTLLRQEEEVLDDFPNVMACFRLVCEEAVMSHHPSQMKREEPVWRQFWVHADSS